MPNARAADRHISAIREFNRFYTQKIGVLRDGLLDSDYTLAEVRVLYEIAHRAAAAGQRPRARPRPRCGLSEPDPREVRAARLGEARALRDDARKAHLHLTAKGRAAFQTLDVRSREEIERVARPVAAGKAGAAAGPSAGVQVAARFASRTRR